ncbi:hypothetical protein RY27_20370, partial [Litorilinea aerophila]
MGRRGAGPPVATRLVRPYDVFIMGTKEMCMHARCRLRLTSLSRHWIVLGILILLVLATVTGTAPAA